MSFIKVEVTVNEEEGFTSLLFVPRDDDESHREQLDTIMRCILDSSLQRRGGFIPAGMRIDVKLPPEQVPDSST